MCVLLKISIEGECKKVYSSFLRLFMTLSVFYHAETTEHDEDYERRMMNSSMVFSLQDSDPPELIPVYDMCQRSPSKEILKTDEV